MNRARFIAEAKAVEKLSLSDPSGARGRCGELALSAEHDEGFLVDLVDRFQQAEAPLVILELITKCIDPSSPEEVLAFLKGVDAYLTENSGKPDLAVQTRLFLAMSEVIPRDATEELKDETHILVKRNFMKNPKIVMVASFPRREYARMLLHILTKKNARSTLMYLQLFSSDISVLATLIDDLRYDERALTTLAKEILSNTSDVNVSNTECVLLLIALTQHKFVRNICNNFPTYLTGLNKDAILKVLSDPDILRAVAPGLQILAASLANAGTAGDRHMVTDFSEMFCDLLFQNIPSMRMPLISTILTLAVESRGSLERRIPFTVQLLLRLCTKYPAELLDGDVYPILIHALRKGEGECGAEVTHGICRALTLLCTKGNLCQTVYSEAQRSFKNVAGCLRQDTSLMLATQLLHFNCLSESQVAEVMAVAEGHLAEATDLLSNPRNRLEEGANFVNSSFVLDFISQNVSKVNSTRALKEFIVPSLKHCMKNAVLYNPDDSGDLSVNLVKLDHFSGKSTSSFRFLDLIRKFFESSAVAGSPRRGGVHLTNSGFLEYFGALCDCYLRITFDIFGAGAIQPHFTNMLKIGVEEFGKLKEMERKLKGDDATKRKSMKTLMETILWILMYLEFLIVTANTIYDLYSGALEVAGPKKGWLFLCRDALSQMLPFAKDLNSYLTKLTHEIAGTKQSKKRRTGAFHENDQDFRIIFELLATVPKMKPEMYLHSFLTNQRASEFLSPQLRSGFHSDLMISNRGTASGAVVKKEHVYAILDTLEMLQMLHRELEGVSNQSWIPFVRHLRGNAPVHARAFHSRTGELESMESSQGSVSYEGSAFSEPDGSGRSFISSAAAGSAAGATSMYGRKKVLVGTSQPLQFVSVSTLCLDADADCSVVRIFRRGGAKWLFEGIKDTLMILKGGKLSVNHRKVYTQLLASLLTVFTSLVKRTKDHDFCEEVAGKAAGGSGRKTLFGEFKRILKDVQNKYCAVLVLEILFQLSEGMEPEMPIILKESIARHYEDEYLPTNLLLPAPHSPKLRTVFGQQTMRTYSSSMSHKEAYRTKHIEYMMLTYFSVLPQSELFTTLQSYFDALSELLAEMEENKLTEAASLEAGSASRIFHKNIHGIDSSNVSTVFTTLLFLSSTFVSVYSGQFDRYIHVFHKFLNLHRSALDSGTIKPNTFTIRLLTSFISFVRVKLRRILRNEATDFKSLLSTLIDILDYAKSLCSSIRTDKVNITRVSRRTKRGELGFIPNLMMSIEALEQDLRGVSEVKFSAEQGMAVSSISRLGMTKTDGKKREKGQKRQLRPAEKQKSRSLSALLPLDTEASNPPLKKMRLESPRGANGDQDLETEWLEEFETREYDSMFYETEDDMTMHMQQQQISAKQDGKYYKNEIGDDGYGAKFYDTES